MLNVQSYALGFKCKLQSFYENNLLSYLIIDYFELLQSFHFILYELVLLSIWKMLHYITHLFSFISFIWKVIKYFDQNSSDSNK